MPALLVDLHDTDHRTAGDLVDERIFPGTAQRPSLRRDEGGVDRTTEPPLGAVRREVDGVAVHAGAGSHDQDVDVGGRRARFSVIARCPRTEQRDLRTRAVTRRRSELFGDHLYRAERAHHEFGQRTDERSAPGAHQPGASHGTTGEDAGLLQPANLIDHAGQRRSDPTGKLGLCHLPVGIEQQYGQYARLRA